MGEEALPFTMILCPLFVAVGYDTVIAVLVTYVATQIGFGSSWMNRSPSESHRESPVLTSSPAQVSVW